MTQQLADTLVADGLAKGGLMTTSLITGANKGLGFETARQLIAAGHRVWIGARDRDRGQQAADQLGAGLVQLDVTDDASVPRRTRPLAHWTCS